MSLNLTHWAFKVKTAHLEEVKFPPGAAGANQEVFGKEETLALSFLLQRQGTQSDLAELSTLHRRQLDERACRP